MWPFLGGLVSGIGSLAGGLMNADAATQAAQINAQAQEQTNAQNIAFQQEFAQNGIQWKVADAAKAGINPLAALGANTQSFSNVVAPQPGATNARPGDALTNSGQNVGRAIASTQSADDQAYSEASRALTLQHMQLQNDFIQSQIESSRARTTFQPGNGPSTPQPAQTYMGSLPSNVTVIPGSSATGVQVDPDKVTAGIGSVSAGVHPEVSLSRTSDGGLYPEPSHDMSVAMFNPWSQTAWSYRNMLLPTVSSSARPEGMRGPEWEYDPMQGYYRVDPSKQYPKGSWGYWVDRNKWFGDYSFLR